jgi:lysophospholipase L1-like esterase
MTRLPARINLLLSDVFRFSRGFAALTLLVAAVVTGGCAVGDTSVAEIRTADEPKRAMITSSISQPRSLSTFAERIVRSDVVRIVVFGDSISEVGVSPRWHGGASSPETNWASVFVERLHDAYPQVKFDLVFLGIGGQNSYEGLGRSAAIADLKPHLVLVAFGANDCWWHHLLPEQTNRAQSELIEKVRKYSEVVVISTGGNNPADDRFMHVEETVIATSDAAATKGVPFVDVYSAMHKATNAGSDWKQYHLGETNCHPNDSGHRVWAAEVFDVVEKSLRLHAADVSN